MPLNDRPHISHRRAKSQMNMNARGTGALLGRYMLVNKLERYA